MSRPTEQQIADRLARLKAQATPGRGDLTPEEDQEKCLCEASFYEFVKRAWQVVDPSPFVEAWHIRTMCEALQKAYAEGRNLLILCPPGVGKSLIASVLYPCWLWAKDPTERFLASSHGRDISTRDTRRSRDVLRSGWFQRLWPHVKLLSDQDQKTRYQNTAGGWRIATSTGSGVTGERARLIILDDPVDLRAAFYPQEIELAVEHLRTALRSRGTGDKTRYIGVMQRLSYYDFAGALIEEAERGGLQWDVLRLPMRYDGNPDPRDQRRSGGSHEGEELLFGELFGEEEVSRLEVSYGPRAAAILQQAPSREQGAIFKREWVKWYYQQDVGGTLDFVLDDPGNPRVYRQNQCAIFATVDLASSLSGQADFTVLAAWAVTPERDLLLLDLLWERLPGERQLPALKDFYFHWKPWKIAVESTGYQLSFVQRAAAEGLPVEPIKRAPGQHRELRVAPLAQLMAEGRFFVLRARDGMPPDWLDAYLEEVLSFPFAPHDDVLDVSADAAREAMLGAYTWRYVDSGTAYDQYTFPELPFGPADERMVRFDPPFGLPVTFEPPFGWRY